jgi:phospho-N-acetylmuramoyl-pentapeptide-transferase
LTPVLVAAGVAFLVTLILGPIAIPLLHRLRFGQRVRSDGPARHLQKTGTPTMGGVMFLIGAAAAVPAVAFLPGGPPAGWAEGLVVLAVALGFGVLGFLDDFSKMVHKRSLGLRAREKLFGQVLIAVALAVVSVFVLERGTDFPVPFSGLVVSGGLTLDLGWWFFLGTTVFVVLATANAVNLTDGLDGLAAGTFAVAALAFAVIALVMDKTGVGIVLGALIGGSLGFLCYNYYPARVFMGDTGSLALGGGLSAAAVITKSELFLLIIGGVFVAETLSVIIQVLSYQLTRRRVFRMAPLHHHFELAGWSETRVVLTFWTVGVVLALLGLAGLRGLG